MENQIKNIRKEDLKMSKKFIKKVAFEMIIFSSFLFWGLGTLSAQPKISAELKAIPETYSGPCPTTIKFQGSITVTNLTRPPLKVQYKFIRSDGAFAPVNNIHFERNGSKPVSTTWTIGGPGLPAYEGWQAIKVVYPQDVESNRANFKIECKAEAAREPLREDCVSFNPDKAEVKQIGGRWKIVDGDHWLFDFGEKKSEAELALKIIKHYHMNQSCFVGRPQPSFSYLLVSGSSPVGAFSGEDCVSFSPARAEVKNIGGRWKIVDGDHWLFDFGAKESEARQALAIIKKYHFNRSCFVGRPHPSFVYLRREKI
jgi:hypothetical protein